MIGTLLPIQLEHRPGSREPIFSHIGAVSANPWYEIPYSLEGGVQEVKQELQLDAYD